MGYGGSCKDTSNPPISQTQDCAQANRDPSCDKRVRRGMGELRGEILTTGVHYGHHYHPPMSLESPKLGEPISTVGQDKRQTLNI